MKIILLLITLLPSILHGQKVATSFQNAVNTKGISIEALDTAYPSALHEDSTKAVFKGQEKEFYKGYVSLLTDLGKFLKQNDFSWGKATRCFNRIYINKNGKIDYFLFHFSEGQIENQKEKEFERLLGEFILTYRFPLPGPDNFAQCSPVTFSDK